MLLRDYCASWLARLPGRLQPRTVIGYANACRLHILPALGAIPVAALTRAQVRDFLIDRRAAGYADSTCRFFLAVLATMLEAAVHEDELRETNPAREIGRILRRRKDPLPMKALTRDQLAQFFEAVCHRCPGLAPLLFIMARCGLRIGEALALRWEDVDLERRMLTIRRSVYRGQEGPPKSGHPRVVSLSQQACGVLQMRLAEEERREPTALAFPGPQGRPCCRSKIRRTLLAAAAAAHLPRVTPHWLRYSFASQLAEGGTPVLVIRDLLGHGDVRTTLRYCQFRGGYHAAVDRLDC